MLEAALSALESSALAQALSASRYAYPLVNAAHIMALATLFGSILALDLRLLGVFRAVPVQPLAAVLPRVAATGLAVAIPTGVLLFSVQPFDYAANSAFLIKISLVALGTAHALWVHGTAGWKALAGGGTIAPRLRLSAAMSILIWTSAIIAGRFIAF